MLRISLFLVAWIFGSCQATALETITDKDVLNLVKTEKYVVILFTKKHCEECENLENILIHLREDLVDSLSAWVVKVVDSKLTALYSPDDEPILVFFRHGIPLLYDGHFNDEEILTTFTESKEPILKELGDDTFEHLTQASSGATTGDWFLMFYSPDCRDCMRLIARWETVASKLKHRVNVVLINKYTTGAATARRFNVYDMPQFIFLRHGYMYHYRSSKHDVNSFVKFARSGYQIAQKEKVPDPSSFNDVTQIIANFLRDNPWIMKLGSICIGVVIIISVASKVKRKSETPQKKEK